MAVLTGDTKALESALRPVGGGVPATSVMNAWLSKAAEAGTGHQSIVEWLINNGAEVDARSSLGTTSFQSAVSSGHVPLARLLLERRADLHALDSHGCSAAQRVLGSFSCPMLRFLAEHSAVPKDLRTCHPGLNGKTASGIEVAAHEGLHSCVQLFL